MLEPRNNPFFIGHEQEIKNLSALLASNRVPHAFLICGTRGIGKATLAFRLARFILAGKLDSGNSNNLFGEPEIDLSMESGNPIFAKISGGSHPDLVVLETNIEEEKKEITVDDVRKIGGFLKMTSAESGWRVVIIDSVDEMNRNAANALLKILEEPTAQSILILISHSPGRLLATIRSRSSTIKLNPLPQVQIREIFEKIGEESHTTEANFAIQAADGAPGTALLLATNKAAAIYRDDFLGIISAMPEPDILKIMEFGERVSGKNHDEWYIVNYLIDRFINRAAKYSAGAKIDFSFPEEKEAIEKLLAISSMEKLSKIAATTQEWRINDEIFHLDRRVIVTDIFNLFKKAA